MVDVIFLNFIKAFDSIPYNILLDKLSNCEIKRFMLLLINTFDHRALSVVVNAAMSGWWPVTGEDPPGSILGSSLLNIFIHYLTARVRCILYCEDIDRDFFCF